MPVIIDGHNLLWAVKNPENGAPITDAGLCRILDSYFRLVGDKAEITKKVGTKFSIYGGDITGENLELVPDRKIVQTWRYNDWPEGHYSKATFLLEKSSSGTKLTFTQTDVPEDRYDDIAQGWKDYYWQPMKEMLEKS